MDRGYSLVELLVALACSSLVMLVLFQWYQVSASTRRDMRESWYCMQSLRTAAVQLNRDMVQSAFLLPQDLRCAISERHLFLSGVPTTSSHSGLRVSPVIAPPYYAVTLAGAPRSLQIDSMDIDEDGRADFWADLGIITDRGPSVIGHAYVRGAPVIPLSWPVTVLPGDRVVPAVHYELKHDGLYRNDQLLAEAISTFSPEVTGSVLKISMRAQFHGTCKDLSMSFTIP